MKASWGTQARVENPINELQQLRAKVRKLASDHEQAAEEFRRSQVLGGIAVKIGAEWLEERLRRPTGELQSAALALRQKWRLSPTYRQLEDQLEKLVEETRRLLRVLFARPPSLREVREAAMLNTKARRLDQLLGNAIERLEAWLSSGRPMPVRSPRRRTPAKPNSPARAKAKFMEPRGSVLRDFAALLGIAGFTFAILLIPMGYASALLLSLLVAMLEIIIVFFIKPRLSKAD